MFRRIAFFLAVVVLAGFGMAQFVVSPTIEAGPDQIDKGVEAASVNQIVSLRVPRATALHLDVSNLVFDVRPLDGRGWPNSDFDFGGEMVCVYGSSPVDIYQQLGERFYHQVQVLPLGTYYADAGYPNIEIINHGGLVTAYPPIQLDGNGELVPGSKDHFICWRTFFIQKFSNGAEWQLTVERVDEQGTLQHIYIQDNPCDTFGTATGLYELVRGEPLQLVPMGLGVGPTGFRSARNPEVCGFKSWLDDLVVVAVKVNADYAGDNYARLRYTLTTTAWWD